MDPQQDPRLLIIALKGLPTSLVALLRNYPQPVTQAHLCDMLNSTDKTMSSALHKLEAFQILSHCSKGWSVTVHIVLLGFSLPEWLQVAVEPVKPVKKPVTKGRKISDSSPLTTSSTGIKYLTNLKPEKNLLPVLDLEPETELKPEPEPELRSEDSREFRECRQAALQAGIEEPRASNLAKLPHVSVELIEGHVAAALLEGQKIGLGIYRIEHNWPVKMLKATKISRDLCVRQKYVTGRYADFIQH